jgi:hypothetical protein
MWGGGEGLLYFSPDVSVAAVQCTFRRDAKRDAFSKTLRGIKRSAGRFLSPVFPRVVTDPYCATDGSVGTGDRLACAHATRAYRIV